MRANTTQRRTLLAALLALTLALLAWAAIAIVVRLNPPAGPLLVGQPATHHCTSGHGSTSFSAARDIYDIPDAPAYLESAQAEKTANLRDVKTSVDNQAPVGDALPDPQLFVSGNYVTIAVTGTVVDPTKRAHVQGLEIRYSLSAGRNEKPTQYAGTLLWTATQSPTTCP